MKPRDAFPTIRSADNPRFREWFAALRKGRAVGDGRPLLAVHGEKLLAEALAAGWKALFAAARGAGAWAERLGRDSRLAGAERMLLTERLFEKLADVPSPQEPCAIVTPPDGWMEPAQTGRLPAGLKRLVVADSLQDPGNLGAALRCARAFGFEAVAATPGTASAFSPKVLRASAGAVFHVPVFAGFEPQALSNALNKGKFQIVVLDARGEHRVDAMEWREPLALVIGNEAHGASEVWSHARAFRARIPMEAGCESLNAGAAAAIAMFSVAAAIAAFSPAAAANAPRPRA